MKAIITNKFKDMILNAENGIKFQIKGYCFLVDNDHILDQEDEEEISAEDKLKALTLDDIETENNILVTNYDKEAGNTEFIDRLFDLTYVPMLEFTTDNYDGLGLYSIPFDNGIFNSRFNNENGFNSDEFNKSFDAILLIGEMWDETVLTNPITRYTTKPLNEYYLAAIIKKEDDDTFNLPIGLSDEIVNKQFNFEITISDKDEVKEMAYNENQIKIKDITDIKDKKTIQLVSNVFVSPTTADYNKQLEVLDVDIDQISYLNSKFNLVDECDIVSNNWNTYPMVNIFDKNDYNTDKPQMLLSYSDSSMNVNEISFTYKPSYGKFAINQTTGNDNLQVDIFPEDVDEENKICQDDIIKKKNLYNYADLSSNARFFRLHTSSGCYNDSYNTTEITSKNNCLDTTYSASFYKSNNNSLNDNVTNISFFDSNNNTISGNITSSIFISTDNTNLIGSNHKDFNDLTLIGVNELYNTEIPTYNIKNITVIGNNNPTLYMDNINVSSLNIPKLNTFNVDGYYELNINNKTYKKSFFIDLIEGQGTTFNTEGNIETDLSDISLIGFNGLVATKNLYRTPIYENYVLKYYNDYEKYEHDPESVTWEKPNNYSLIMGSYNAISNQYPLNFAECSSIADYLNNVSGISTEDNFVNGTEIIDYYQAINPRMGTTLPPDVYTIGDESCDFHLGRYYFKNPFDGYYNDYDTFMEAYNSNELSACEGDYSLNKIFVVGNNYKNIRGADDYTLTTTENVSKYGRSCAIKRINLFSVEKDSYQLVHHDSIDTNGYFSASDVMHIPSMFAVRSLTKPISNTYYHYFNNHEPIKANVNSEYYMQNCIYTPSSILIPLKRSSNDGYKIRFSDLQLQGMGFNVPSNDLDTSELDEALSNLKTNNTNKTYVLYLKEDVLGFFKNFIQDKYNITINDNSFDCYTFYLVNSTDTNLKVACVKYFNKNGVITNKSKWITLEPSECQRIIYYPNNNRVYGIVNVDIT